MLLGAAMTLGLIGCASNKDLVRLSDEEALRYQQNVTINKQILEVASSVNESLDTLVKSEKGSAELKRVETKNGVVDTTVLKSSENAAKMNDPYASLQAPRSSADASEVGNVDVRGIPPTQKMVVKSADAEAMEALKKQTKIRWNGRVDEMLSGLAKSIGFDFQIIGVSNSIPEVKIVANGASVGQVLRMAADQLDAGTDINVITKDKTLVLIYR